MRRTALKALSRVSCPRTPQPRRDGRPPQSFGMAGASLAALSLRPTVSSGTAGHPWWEPPLSLVRSGRSGLCFPRESENLRMQALRCPGCPSGCRRPVCFAPASRAAGAPPRPAAPAPSLGSECGVPGRGQNTQQSSDKGFWPSAHAGAAGLLTGSVSRSSRRGSGPAREQLTRPRPRSGCGKPRSRASSAGRARGAVRAACILTSVLPACWRLGLRSVSAAVHGTGRSGSDSRGFRSVRSATPSTRLRPPVSVTFPAGL